MGNQCVILIGRLGTRLGQRTPALSVGGRLSQREARQSIVANAAEFAVEVGALDRHLCESCRDARIFLAPVEPGPRQQLHAPMVDARGHAKAVELDFVEPSRP